MSLNIIEPSEWSMPGVRLMDRVLEDAGFDVETHTAVPVFIGWRNPPVCLRDGGQMQRISSRTEYDNATAKARGSTQSVLQQPGANGIKPALRLDWIDKVMGASLKLYFDNGGGPCYVLEIDAPTEGDHLWSGPDSEHSPFTPLLQEPAITLAAMPQLAAWVSEQIKSKDGVSVKAGHYVAAWKGWLGACRERRDVFYVLDAPSDVSTASECLNLLRNDPISLDQGQHAALYGPHLQTDYDLPSKNDVPIENDVPFEEIPHPVVPPCGAVLGLMVRTDAAHGVWRAPANEALSHVVAPVYQTTPPVYRETPLNHWFDVSGASINPIRSFPGRGVRVWGCRTLSSRAGSPFHYVQVRRMVTWLEANLRQICRFAVFEPNGELTWFQLRGLCSAWLRRVWLSGGLAGSDESEAFSVLVGLNESMTQADILHGRLVVKVGVAVLRAAEFLEIELVLSLNASESGATRALGSVTS